MATPAERLADATWLKLTARAAMIALALLGSATVWLAGDWLQRVFTAQTIAFNAVTLEVAELNSKYADVEERLTSVIARVITLEANSQRGREDRLRFEEQMIQTLTALTAAVNRQGERLAAVEATLLAIKDRAEQDDARPGFPFQRPTFYYPTPIYNRGYTRDDSPIRGSPAIPTELPRRCCGP